VADDDVVPRLPHDVKVEKEAAVREIHPVHRARVTRVEPHQVAGDEDRPDERKQDESRRFEDGPYMCADADQTGSARTARNATRSVAKRFHAV